MLEVGVRGPNGRRTQPQARGSGLPPAGPRSGEPRADPVAVGAAAPDHSSPQLDVATYIRQKTAFTGAFIALQAQLPILDERGEIRDPRGKLLYRYALWEDLNEVVKPILAEHGFALWFRTNCDRGLVVVTAVLTHIKGHSEETTLVMPADVTGGKNPVQALGSSTSYGKRYATVALLNLTSRGEDDDGSGTGAGPVALISPAEEERLRALLAETGGSERRLLAYLGVEALDRLPASRLARAIEAMTTKGALQ